MKSLDLWCVRLTELRNNKGLTQTELAKQSGLSQELISQLENGKRKFTQKSLDQLLKVFEADYKQLFVRTQTQKHPRENIDYKKWLEDKDSIINTLKKENQKLKTKIQQLRDDSTRETRKTDPPGLDVKKIRKLR